MSSRCCWSIARRSASIAGTCELRPLVARRRVHVDQLADLRQREPEPLAAQDQLEARALALAVDAGAPRARGASRPCPRRSGSRASSARTRCASSEIEYVGADASAAVGLAWLAGGIDGGHRSAAAREMRIGRGVTIAYRLDSLGGLPEDATLRKRAMTADSPPAPRSTIPYARRRRRRAHAIEIAPGVLWLRMPLPFALDHINLWLLEERRRRCTLVDCGFGDRRDARALGAPLRDDARGRCRSGASSSRTTIRTTSATPRGSPRASARRCDDPGRIPDRACGRGPARRHTRRADDRALSPRTAWRDEHVAALAQARQHYRRGVPELPQSFDADASTATRALRATTWRVIVGHGHSPEHAALYCAERGVLISGDMLLPRISTNVSVWRRRARRRSARGASSIRSRVYEPARGHAGAAFARPAVPRHRRARRASFARITPSGSTNWSDALRRRAAPQSRRRPRPGAVPPRARPAAALLRDGRGDRAPQLPVARGRARAHASATDGVIRFAA